MADKFQFYKSIVYQMLPRANFIYTPAVSGAKKNVILAREPDGNVYAFKFSGKDYAIRNANIAHALRNAGVPAPEITAQNYDGQWFEMYPAVHGTTLHECVADRISQTELNNLYTKLLELLNKMSYIDHAKIDFCDLKYSYKIACRDTTQTNNKFIGTLTGAFVRLMNIGSHSDQGLYHYGITPKNVIVSNRGEIAGILDIDETGICNINYALGVMLAKAKLIGMDVKTLCDKYELISGHRINRAHLAAVINIQNMGRNILYRTKSK